MVYSVEKMSINGGPRGFDISLITLSIPWSRQGDKVSQEVIFVLRYKSSPLAPSSSGLGHLVLIQEIRGSTPLGAAN